MNPYSIEFKRPVEKDLRRLGTSVVDRIIYSIDTEARILVVHYVRHRRDAYR